jgi:hypothetical protein
MGPAAAHHGWGYYDTNGPLYIVGRVTAVNWRNPHPAVTIEARSAPLPPSWANLPVPRPLRDLDFDDTLGRVKPLGEAGAWTLELAPINRLENWGMPRPPRIGDEMVAIAFPSCSQPKVARPALIVLDGVGVRQQSVALPSGCAGK